jgi:hypothetical protein
VGVRLCDEDLGLSPEIGVYYDHASPDLRGRRVIFVPSVTIYPADVLSRLSGSRPRAAAHPVSNRPRQRR